MQHLVACVRRLKDIRLPLHTPTPIFRFIYFIIFLYFIMETLRCCRSWRFFNPGIGQFHLMTPD